MKKLILNFIIYFSFLALLPLNASNLNSNLIDNDLTVEEKNWLKQNPTIKLAFMKGWPTDNKQRNIHTEMIKLLSEYSGLNFIPAHFDTWKDGFEEASKGESIHGIMSLSWTKERQEKYFHYTKPYYFITASIIVKKENNNITSLNDFKGKTIYVKEKSITNNIVKEFSKDISIINLDNEELMLAKLANSNEARGLLTHNPKHELLDKYGLKIAKNFFTKYSDLSIGVSHNHKPLHSIINKIYSRIPSTKLINLQNKQFKDNGKGDFVQKLNTEEKKWLKSNPLIKIAFMNYWTTDDYGNNIHSDFIKLLNKYSNFQIVTAKYNAWKDGFNEAVKGNNIHGIMNLSWSKERSEKLFHYTKAYNFIPNYLIVRKNNETIKSLNDLKNKTIYIKEKEISHKTIEDLPFKVNIIDVKDDNEMMQKLSTLNEADAYLSYTADKNKLKENNLKVAKILYDKYGEVAIGVSKQYKLLQSIFNKLVDSIPKEEIAALRNKKYEKVKKAIFVNNLTAKEQAWLKEHKVIKIGVDAAYAPYAFVDVNGNFSGVAADFARIISKMLNIKMEMVPGLTWPQIIQASKDKTIDLITTASYRPERDAFLNFTQGYIPTPLVIMTKSDNNKILKRDDIKGQKIALVKKYSSSKNVLQEFKDQFEPYFVDTPLDGLKAVSIGKADAYIGVLGINIHQSIKAGISNLKVAAPYNLETNYQNYGVRKDWPILADILDKALDAIPEEDKIKIFQKWVPVGENTKEKMLLTKEEQKWLVSNNTKIKMCVDPDWMPFEKINDKGEYIGIGADYINMFSNKLGYPIELFKTKSWNDSLEKIKNSECDILPLAMKTEQREKYLNFTTHYLSFPLVIATTKEKLYVDNIENILDKKIGLVKGYAYIEIFKKRYPNINIVEVDNVREGLQKVNQGKLYAFVDNIASVAYEIQKSKMVDVKISGQTDDKWKLGIAVREDAPELLSIFQKLVDSIKEEDMARINSKWVSVKFEHGFDYTLLWKILAIVLIIILIFIYWNRKLAIEVQKRKKAQEEANNANAAKSMFLARMSHEIRTPMNAILGMLYLTQKTNLNPIQDNYIVKAKNATDSLLHVINDILDFSKIEAGKLDIESVEFDFYRMLDKVTSIMSFKAEEKGLELLVNHDSKIPQYIISDPIRIEQILVNLIGNAIKFTYQGEIVISPKLISTKDDQLLLEFCIQDSGIGISKTDQEKLFKDFSQVDESTTRKFGGSGLGLAISKKLSTLLGGKIWLEESIENKGSNFCFTIKCKTANTQRQSNKVFPNNLKNLKTLIVDDNKIACNILSNMLRDFELQSDIVYSGEEALEDIIDNKHRYDIIFLDYKLGGLNGVQTYERLKEHLKEETPKVVMISAYSKDEVITECKKAGIESFLTKPVHPSLLFNSIVHTFSDSEQIETIKKESTKQDISIKTIQGAHVLLVEDNELNQEFGIILLESNGIHVDVANDGIEALKMVQLKKYDLVLMDIQMPNMDGLEASNEIRKLNDKYYSELPIVALSAHAMPTDIQKSLDAGMNAHITKPINPNELFEIMLTYIPAKHDANLIAKESSQSNNTIFINFESRFIDYESGLKRINNNELDYLKILRNFAIKYKEFPTLLQELIDTKELIQAERKTHEIKGIAGNIGANQLFESLQNIDNTLKKEKEPQEKELQKSYRLLAQTIEEIEQIKFQEDEKDTKEFDLEMILSLLKKIETNLEVNIIDSEDALEELVPYMQDEQFKDLIVQLKNQIEVFDTDLATKTIESIRKALEQYGD